MPPASDAPIAGLVPTGRRLVGPAADLVELDSNNGLKHTAVVFHPEHRGHDAIGSALDVVLGFLESPMVTGLVELVAVDRDQGAFVYPTGEAWSVAEVIRVLADFGESAGVRAGLELMYAAGQILAEAADVGEAQGVYSHGGLTPWRVMLKRDGQVLVIGHALPQVEILQFHADSRRIPREDSFRYCPPERIEAAPEDLSSDLFSLALIAFELMTGKPVYDGLVNDIRQQAARGEGSRRLFRFRDVLPQSVRDVLTYALRPDRGDRYPTGDDFLESVRAVLSSRDAEGPSLLDVMMRVNSAGKRTGTALEGGKTQMLTKEQIMAMLEEDDGPPAVRTSSDGVRGRSASAAWSPPPERAARRAPRSREAGAATPAEAAPVEVAPPAAPPPGTLPPGASPAAEGAPAEGARWSRVSRASRASAPAEAPSEEAGPSPLAAAASGGAGDLLARIRSSSDRPALQEPAGKPRVADLLEQVVRSSGGGGADEGPRFEKGRARRSRRSRDGEADGPPPIPGLAAPPAPPAVPPPAATTGRAGPPPVVPVRVEVAPADAAGPTAEEAPIASPRVSPGRARGPVAAPVAVATSAGGGAPAEHARSPQGAAPVAPGIASPRAAAAAPAATGALDADAGQPGIAAGRATSGGAARAGAGGGAATNPRDAGAGQPGTAAGRAWSGGATSAGGPGASSPTRAPAGEGAAAIPGAPGAAAPRPAQAAAAPPAEAAAVAPAAVAPAAVAPASVAPASVAPATGAPASGGPGPVTSGERAPAAGAPAAGAPTTAAPAGGPRPPWLDRAPDPIPSPAGGNHVAIQLVRGPGARPFRVRLPGDMSAADAVARLVGTVLPIRTDLSGGLAGWWRLVQDDALVPSTAPLSQLAEERPVLLHLVENRLERVEVQVGATDPPARFLATVGVAVPAVSLADHLAGWLDLPAGRWVVHVDGRALQPYELLADLPAAPGGRVVELRAGEP